MPTDMTPIYRELLQETITDARKRLPSLMKTPHGARLSIEIGTAYVVLTDANSTDTDYVFATNDLQRVMRMIDGTQSCFEGVTQGVIQRERGAAAWTRITALRQEYDRKRGSGK